MDDWDALGDKEKVEEAVDYAQEVGVPADMSADNRDTFEEFLRTLDENDSYQDYEADVEPLVNGLESLRLYTDENC